MAAAKALLSAAGLLKPNTKLLKKSTATEHARGTQHKAKCCVGCGGCEDCKGSEDMTFVVVAKESAAEGATTLFW